MNHFTIRDVSSIRFERTFIDGTTTYFSIGEPKSLKFQNAEHLLQFCPDYYNQLDNEKFHNWESVFNPDTRIIICGEVHELNEVGELVRAGTGEFDFRELCNGKMVCLKSYNTVKF